MTSFVMSQRNFEYRSRHSWLGEGGSESKFKVSLSRMNANIVIIFLDYAWLEKFSR